MSSIRHALLSCLLLVPVAAEADDPPRTVALADASALGPPANHDPFTDCTCVGLAWNDPEPTMLDVPRDEVVELRHVVGDGAPDQLVLSTRSGGDLVLERAPCAFVADQIQRYSAVLGIPARIVDAAGAEVEPTCDPLAGVRAWDEAKQATTRFEVVHSLGVPMAGLAIAGRGAAAEAVAGDVGRDWAGLRPRLGHCFAREQDPAPRGSARLKLVAQVSGELRDVRVVGRGTGSERVDTCIADVVTGATISRPPAADTPLKVDVEYAPAQ